MNFNCFRLLRDPFMGVPCSPDKSDFHKNTFENESVHVGIEGEYKMLVTEDLLFPDLFDVKKEVSDTVNGGEKVEVFKNETFIKDVNVKSIETMTNVQDNGKHQNRQATGLTWSRSHVNKIVNNNIVNNKIVNNNIVNNKIVNGSVKRPRGRPRYPDQIRDKIRRLKNKVAVQKYRDKNKEKIKEKRRRNNKI